MSVGNFFIIICFCTIDLESGSIYIGQFCLLCRKYKYCHSSVLLFPLNNYLIILFERSIMCTILFYIHIYKSPTIILCHHIGTIILPIFWWKFNLWRKWDSQGLVTHYWYDSSDIFHRTISMDYQIKVKLSMVKISEIS